METRDAAGTQLLIARNAPIPPATRAAQTDVPGVRTPVYQQCVCTAIKTGVYEQS